jgi:uncharacterized surface anchored protein
MHKYPEGHPGVSGIIAFEDRWSNAQQKFMNRAGDFTIIIGTGETARRIDNIRLDGTGTAIPGISLTLVNTTPTNPAVNNGFRLELNANTLNIRTNSVKIIYSTMRIGAHTTADFWNDVQIGLQSMTFATADAIRATVKALVGSAISKNGVAATVVDDDSDSGYSNVINWTVSLNAANFSYAGDDVQIVDTLGKGQILLPSTINVYRGSSATSGTRLTRGTDYDFNIFVNPITGTTTLTIDFFTSYIFNTTHTVTYRSKVDDDTITMNSAGVFQVSNSVELNVNGTRQARDAKDVASRWTILSGYGSGARIPLIIEKVNSQYPGRFLTGAIFELQDENGNTFLENIRIDSPGPHVVQAFMPNDAGTLVLGDLLLPAGTYQLVETQAPEGFTISKDTIVFEITADEISIGEMVLRVGNDPPVPLTVVKRDATSNALLAGAVFELQDADGGPRLFGPVRRQSCFRKCSRRHIPPGRNNSTAGIYITHT